MDGVISMTPESYAPEAIAGIRENWFGKRGKPFYTCGPLVPLGERATVIDNEKKQSAASEEIQVFLDKTLKESGEKSLLYVCLTFHALLAKSY